MIRLVLLVLCSSVLVECDNSIIFNAIDKINGVTGLKGSVDIVLDLLFRKDITNDRIDEVLKGVNKLSSQIDRQFEESMHLTKESFKLIQDQLKKQDVNSYVVRADTYRNTINDTFNDIQNFHEYENHTLEMFVTKDHEETLRQYHEQYFSSVGISGETLFERLVKLLNDDASLQNSCGSKVKSVQNQVTDIFQNIMWFKVKGRVVVELKFFLLAKSGRGSFKNEKNYFLKKWLKYDQEADEIFERAFKSLDIDFYHRCFNKQQFPDDSWTSLDGVTRTKRLEIWERLRSKELNVYNCVSEFKKNNCQGNAYYSVREIEVCYDYVSGLLL